MLLNPLQCTGQPPKQGINQPKMSIVLRLKNPALAWQTEAIVTPAPPCSGPQEAHRELITSSTSCTHYWFTWTQSMGGTSKGLEHSRRTGTGYLFLQLPTFRATAGRDCSIFTKAIQVCLLCSCGSLQVPITSPFPHPRGFGMARTPPADNLPYLLVPLTLLTPWQSNPSASALRHSVWGCCFTGHPGC